MKLDANKKILIVVALVLYLDRADLPGPGSDFLFSLVFPALLHGSTVVAGLVWFWRKREFVSG